MEMRMVVGMVMGMVIVVVITPIQSRGQVYAANKSQHEGFHNVACRISVYR